jgi:hypothetical protein
VAAVLSGSAALPAAVVVVHLYGVALTIILWVLIRHLADRCVADRGTALFCFFPGAAVLSMVYAEAVMLTFAAACLYALITRRWLIAGAAAALAGAARPTGVVLVACCLFQSLQFINLTRESTWRPLIAPGLAPVGTVAFFGYLWTITGRLDSSMAAHQVGWGAGIDYGARILRGLSAVLRNPLELNVDKAMELFGLGIVLVGGMFLWRWRPPAVVWVYTIGVLMFTLMTYTGTAGGTRPRFVMAAFPLIIAIARSLRGGAYVAALLISAALMAASAIVYTTPWWVIP